MKIINLFGVLEKSCGCVSWLAHWEKCSGLRADFCAAKNCRNRDLVGAHVKRAINGEDIHYIIPLCKKQHAISPEIDIYEGTRLIVYETTELCEKTVKHKIQC